MVRRVSTATAVSECWDPHEDESDGTSNHSHHSQVRRQSLTESETSKQSNNPQDTEVQSTKSLKQVTWSQAQNLEAYPADDVNAWNKEQLDLELNKCAALTKETSDDQSTRCPETSVVGEARLVESQQEAEEIIPDLLAARVLGLDCEGVSLGRWGRLCLCQVATPQQVFLFDALRSGVVEVLRPVLTSTAVTKVMHDSREDSSAFLSQFDIELAGVYDSQVAHTMMLEQQAIRPFQISLNELLKTVLKLENEKEMSLGHRMKKDPNVWFYRPMREDLLTYAAQDVMYLPLLHQRLCDQLGDRSGSRVMSRSKEYVNYAHMNLHLSSPKAAERRGLRLQAMLATQTEAALYFKLNLGAHRQGVVSREEALKNFKDMHYGEIAGCWVSAWNPGGNILFLERLEGNNFTPDPPDFTSGKMGRRRGRRPFS